MSKERKTIASVIADIWDDIFFLILILVLVAMTANCATANRKVADLGGPRKYWQVEYTLDTADGRLACTETIRRIGSQCTSRDICDNGFERMGAVACPADFSVWAHTPRKRKF